jgi:hypothetical protein
MNDSRCRTQDKFKVPGSKFKEKDRLVHLEP